jgi:hypothetical protein
LALVWVDKSTAEPELEELLLVPLALARSHRRTMSWTPVFGCSAPGPEDWSRWSSVADKEPKKIGQKSFERSTAPFPTSYDGIGHCGTESSFRQAEA